MNVNRTKSFSVHIIRPFLFIQDGDTPLYLAAQEGNTEIVQDLLMANAQVNLPEKV